ncbi:MAG: hypothetical protein ABFD69_05995 [Candidatus Sumerlaeia bacterium]
MTRLDTHFGPADTGEITHFTIGDMLLPATLLEDRNWRDNPLVLYSERRARRPVRFLLTELLELVLVGCLALMAAHIFYTVIRIKGVPVRDWHRWFLTDDGLNRTFVFPENLMPYFYGGFIFLLLRYHLFVNDQSNHMKNLSRGRLGELLVTHLGRDEFFLHHMLIFCQRYRVIVGWAAVWAVFIAADVLSGGWVWVEPEIYAWLFMTLYLVLIVWIAGVYQYVTEWKWFAGGRGRKWSTIAGLFFSMFLSLGMALTLAAWHELFSVGGRFWRHDVAVALPIGVSIAALAFAMAVTYPKAYFLYGAAEETLRRRYDP